MVETGDWISVKEHVYDGWAYGVNLRTKMTGLFPLPVTVPHCPQRLVVLNCCRSAFDVFGQDVLEGALLAYPDYIAVHHVFSRGSPMGVDAETIAKLAPGLIQSGRLSPSYIDVVAHDARLDPNAPFESQKVIVCGPKRLQGDVYDYLTSNLRIKHDSIRLMAPDAVE